jgi:hypothetical protein
MPIPEPMSEAQDQNGKRVERAAFETDRLLVVGDVTLPPEGYQSRFSDSLNRGELEFLPLTDCEVTRSPTAASSGAGSRSSPSATSGSPTRPSRRAKTARLVHRLVRPGA